jgi:hypothetical protein
MDIFSTFSKPFQYLSGGRRWIAEIACLQAYRQNLKPLSAMIPLDSNQTLAQAANLAPADSA